jgi:hypothetical protein
MNWSILVSQAGFLQHSGLAWPIIFCNPLSRHIRKFGVQQLGKALGSQRGYVLIPGDIKPKESLRNGLPDPFYLKEIIRVFRRREVGNLWFSHEMSPSGNIQVLKRLFEVIRAGDYTNWDTFYLFWQG